MKFLSLRISCVDCKSFRVVVMLVVLRSDFRIKFLLRDQFTVFIECLFFEFIALRVVNAFLDDITVFVEFLFFF